MAANDSGFSSRVFNFDSTRFVNQHHRNVITNRIDALALGAFQPAAIRLQFDFSLARGAGKYLQQILTNRHSLNLLILSRMNRFIHLL